MPATGTSTYTACAGTVYDPGGASTYPNYCSGTMTLYPAIVGNYIQLVFNSFSLESGYDNLYIYDGPTTSDPLIGQYTASSSPGTVYATSSSGAITLYFYTDGSVTLNGFDATLSCITTPPPSSTDLVIISQTASPTSVAAGNTVSASCYIYNQGTSLASSSTVGYYLSTDALWDAGDTYLNYSTGGSLAASASSYRSSVLTIPLATTPGSYYILYFADYSNVVSESVETNNVVAVAINVLSPVMDLVIQTQTASPTTVASGSTVAVSCYIYNQGNTTASSSNVGYYLSSDAIWDAADTYLNFSSGGTLTPLASSYRSSTLTIPVATSPGSYYILYYADYSNVVVENVETNNVVALAINVVAPIVDLVIQSQTANPLVVPSGGTVSASCSIYNQGNVAVTSSNVGFYLSADAAWDAGDTYLNFASGGSLNPNVSATRSATLTIPVATAPGSYYILFFADYSNAVAENVETNNVNYIAITVVSPVIDLVIQSQTTNPITIASGATTAASCYIYNQGNSSASSSNVGYYLSTDAAWDAGDTYLNFSSGSTLASATSAYRSATLTIPVATTPGSYYILYFADYSNAVTENVETNNVNYIAITVVSPVIDLVIQSQTANPLTIASGSTTSASCYIYNQGNTSASSSNVGYYLSADAAWDAGDTYLNFSSGSTLAASASSLRSATLTIPPATTPGAYYILYYADYSNAVTESIETNNVASVPINVVLPTIDLIIQSQTASPTSVLAGNSASVSCYIYNQGNSSASSSNVGYYLSTDAAWDAGDTYLNYSTGGTLAASVSAYRSATVVIPAATAPGAYYILYYADYSNVVSESVETNNVAFVAITVTTPSIDLIIQSQTASPTSVVAGNSVSVSCYIYNQGNATSSTSNVGYYLSTDALWDAADTYLSFSSGSTLAAATSSYRSAVVTIPGATTPGSYYLLYFADYSNGVSETIETNNVATVAITVTSAAVDLIIQSPSATPTTVAAGNSVSASCYIYNQGNSTSTSSNVGYYLSTDAIWDAADVYLNFSSGTALAASTSAFKSISLTIPPATASGSYYILYFADYSGLEAESVETNNVAYVAITVTTPFIDLIITSPSVTPTTISAGGNTSASCFIYNQGNSVSSSSNVGYYLSSDAAWDAADVYMNFSSGTSLNASASANKIATLNIPASTVPGSYYILFYADYSTLVTENVETNNVASISITVTPFTNTILMPASGNNQFTVCSGTIYDDGGTLNYSNSVNSTTTLYPAAAGNMIQLVFNSFVVESCCDYLKIYDGPNTSAALIGTYVTSPGTITATNAGGTLTLQFISDGSVTMAGFDATISCLSAGALPDLAPIYPTCSPMTIPQGSSAGITCQVLNSGSSTAGASIVGYYLSVDTIWDAADVYLNSDPVSSLAASASAAISSSIVIPLATTIGSYYLLYVADTASVVSENIETNNVAWLQINVSLVIGIHPVENDQHITVFPNPSHGSVNFVFNSPSSGSALIRIFDFVGKLTDEFTAPLLPNSETSVLYELNGKGVYLAEIRIGGNNFYKKIIVQ